MTRRELHKGNAMRLLLTLILTLSMTTILFADALVKKDGTLLEGKILRVTGGNVIFLYSEGRQVFPMDQVERLLHDNRHRERYYFYQKTGRSVRGHIVEETRNFFMVRPALKEKREIKILKKNIDVVSKRKLGAKELRKRRSQENFRRHLGLRLGTAARIGILSTNQDIDPKTTWNWETVFFQFYYYDYWFDVNATYQPPMAPGHSSYKSFSGETYGYQPEAGSDEISFSHIYLTGYPFQFFDLDLGITVGHLHYNVKWIRADSIVSGEREYLKQSYQAMSVGVTYRFLNRFRAGANILLPYKARWTYYTDDGPANYTYQIFDQDKLIPGFSVEIAAFIFSNLSLSVEYYFMYSNLDVIYSDTSTGTLGSSPSYMNHRITLAIGYGFKL